MFRHWANPPRGEAFSAGRVQGRSEGDQPLEWEPGPGLPMAAPGEGALNRLQLRSALSVLPFFKAATERGEGAGVS